MIRYTIIILIFRSEMIINLIAVLVYDFKKFINAVYSFMLVALNFKLSLNAFSLKHIMMLLIKLNVLILRCMIYSLFFKCFNCI